jgi:hypothetical protein
VPQHRSEPHSLPVQSDTHAPSQVSEALQLCPGPQAQVPPQPSKPQKFTSTHKFVHQGSHLVLQFSVGRQGAQRSPDWQVPHSPPFGQPSAPQAFPAQSGTQTVARPTEGMETSARPRRVAMRRRGFTTLSIP